VDYAPTRFELERNYSAMSSPKVQPELASRLRSTRFIRRLRADVPPTLALAFPVILAEIGWMGMGLADMFMVGRLGPEAIGAVGLGNILYFTVCVACYGFLHGMDPEVSQAFGAGRLADCHRTLWLGLLIGLALTPLLMGVTWLSVPLVALFGIDASVLKLLTPYLHIMNLTTLPFLAYTALRRYLQGMGIVRPITYTLIAANVVNFAGNWLLVYGHWGFPRLGVSGSGWSTFIARIFMLLGLVAAVLYHDRRKATGLLATPLRIEPDRLRRMLSLGLPAAVQITLELGVFAVAASLAGTMGPAALAAHEIALNVCSFTFMVPFGVSTAGTVRVGQAIGRTDAEAATLAGWTALLLGTAFMAAAALTFVLVPRSIIGVYTSDPGVLKIGVTLLAAAAAFQMFDGIQVVAAGNLRGAGETKTAMYTSLVGYWILGLPVGIVLGFGQRWGVLGVWIGLCVGLIVSGVILLTAWALKAGALRRECKQNAQSAIDATLARETCSTARTAVMEPELA
jgi:MATE family multidrug resistance protein